jgi:ribosomal protein RSM22 (predicted rRNA methylase)
MHAVRSRKSPRLRRPTADRSHRVIRKLCSQCSQLQEEVKQLSAAVQIYKELARLTSR